MGGPNWMRRLLRGWWSATLIVVTAWSVGCGAAVTGGPEHPTDGPSLAAELVAAIDQEAHEPLAVQPYLALVDRAVAQPDDPQAPAAIIAALHALLTRELEELGGDVAHAAAFRSRAGLLETAVRLRHAWASAPLAAGRVRPFLAHALHQLALRVGDVDAAIAWRKRSACIPAAALFGPVASPALTGLDGPSPIDGTSPLPSTVPGIAPFSSTVAPLAVAADACAIELNATSAQRGVRLVVVDLVSPRAQSVTVAITTTSAATVELAGTRVLERPLAAGAQPATLLARVELEAGRARLVARVAQNSDGKAVVLAAWDDTGAPLQTIVPVAGERAPARVLRSEPLDGWIAGVAGSGTLGGPLAEAPSTAAPTAPEVVLGAAALLGLGRAREADALLAVDRARRTSQDGGAPELEPGLARSLALLRLRASALVRDLPPSEALTETQGAADGVLDSCPQCWEPRIAKAAVLGEREGRAKGVFETLTALGVNAAHPEALVKRTAPELAFVALRAGRADLPDIERAAYDALAKVAAGSALLADVDAQLFPRHGSLMVRAACEAGTSRAGPRCLRAHAARGDLPHLRAELRRLRALRGSSTIHQDVELSSLLAEQRLTEALALLAQMPAATRSLAVLGAAVDWPGGSQRLLETARAALARDRLAARDTPYALEPLARLLGAVDDTTGELERAGRELCARDRTDAYLPGAGTAVLRHLEHYDLDDSGLLFYRIYDLRRVSGTTDVAEGAAGSSPQVDGRSILRALRTRIHKRDGRVLDPDPGARGAQGHTELSQLEAGDYVEVIAEGWALPEDSGQLVVDTPDLLPPRTSVREAEIVFARPTNLPIKVWTHAQLGPGETTAADASTSHEQGSPRTVTRWQLRDEPPRRIEEGVASLEARVALSFGTDDWPRIGRAIGARLRGLDERDPYVRQWVQRVVGTEPRTPAEQVARIVTAVGREVHEADADALSDFVASLGGGPQQETARTILERGRGSRCWVVHRALRELGIESRIAVSETEPFGSAPSFPPRPGRFRHPLVVVELGTGPLWIDADVSGPPLPPGQVSPELRGRQALLPTGELLRVEGTMGFEPDEIDLRLRVDAAGDGSGTFTALLRGRAAQQLGEDLRVTVGSERDRLLRSVVLAWFPWADVKEVTLSSDEASWQLSLRAEVFFAGFARPEGRDGVRWSLPGIDTVHSVYPESSAGTLSASYAAQAARTSDLSIAEPLLFHLHRRIELPDGAKVLQVPNPLLVAHPSVSAERLSEQQDRTIDEHFRLNLPATTIATAEFDAFATELRRIDDGFAYGIAVRAPKP